MKNAKSIRYPRRTVIRWFLRWVGRVILYFVSDLKIEGLENIPKTGRVMLAANHFHFTDAPLLIVAMPRQLEFVGGADRINGPSWTEMFPKIYGIIYAFRGGNSRSTIELSKSVLEQEGAMGIFMEGGSWAQVLRPARPGTAMVAHMTNSPIIPVTIDNATSLFKTKKPRVRVVFHPPVTPPQIEGTGRARRRALDTFGESIMEIIASELPVDQQGRYSSCPKARAAALAVSDFPFHAPDLRGK